MLLGRQENVVFSFSLFISKVVALKLPLPVLPLKGLKMSPFHRSTTSYSHIVKCDHMADILQSVIQDDLAVTFKIPLYLMRKSPSSNKRIARCLVGNEISLNRRGHIGVRHKIPSLISAPASLISIL